jgi:hypothetical protein
MVMLGRFNQKIPRGIHPVKAEWPRHGRGGAGGG